MPISKTVSVCHTQNMQCHAYVTVDLRVCYIRKRGFMAGPSTVEDRDCSSLGQGIEFQHGACGGFGKLYT